MDDKRDKPEPNNMLRVDPVDLWSKSRPYQGPPAYNQGPRRPGRKMW